MSNFRYEEHPTVHQLGGHIVDLIRYPDVTDPLWSATNPSIGHNGKTVYASTFRSSNYVIDKRGNYVHTVGDNFQNRVYFSEFDRDWKLRKLRRIDFDGLEDVLSRGVEDAKLFYRDGWWFSGVVVDKTYTNAARMAVFELDSRKSKIKSYRYIPGRDMAVPEKNWMTTSDVNPHFDWVYGPNQLVTGHMLQTWMTDAQPIHNLRGSSNLVEFGEDSYLGVMHRTFYHKSNPYISTTFASVQSNLRDYVHYFVLFDKFGYIQEVSQGFRFHQPGVEFAAGLAFYKDKAVVSFGRRDVSSHLAFIDKDYIVKSLQPVEY